MELGDKAISRRQLLKTFAAAGLAVSGAVLVGACSTPAAPATPATTQAAGKPDVDAARKEGTVSLYTSLDTAIVDLIIKPFKEKYGVEVKYYRAGAREVATKVLTEWDAKTYNVDVLDVSDVPTLAVMKARGDMLVPYKHAAWDAYADNRKEKDGYWCWDRLTQVILGYNTNVIKGGDIPTGWADLADPKYLDKMVTQEPSASALRIYTVAMNMPDGWAWLEKVGKNRPKFVQTVQVMGTMNETGEIPVSIFQNDNIVARSRDSGKPVQIVFPKEGLPTEPGGMAYMKNAKSPNAARLLIDWWLGDEGQKANVAGYKYSPRLDMAPPKGAPPLKDLKLWEEDNATLEKNLNEISDRINKAMTAR